MFCGRRNVLLTFIYRQLDGQGCQASISYKTYFDTEEVRACCTFLCPIALRVDIDQCEQTSHNTLMRLVPQTCHSRVVAVKLQFRMKRNVVATKVSQLQTTTTSKSPLPVMYQQTSPIKPLFIIISSNNSKCQESRSVQLFRCWHLCQDRHSLPRRPSHIAIHPL